MKKKASRMQYEQYEHGYLKYGMVNPLPGGLVVVSLIVQLNFHITSLHVPPGVGVLLAAGGLVVHPGVVVLPGIPPPLAFKASMIYNSNKVEFNS